MSDDDKTEDQKVEENVEATEGADIPDAAADDHSSETIKAVGIQLEDMNAEQQTDDDDEFPLGEPMAKDVEAIYDIPVQISAVLGRSTMQVSQLLKLGRGAVVELDRKVGEAIDIYVNNRLVARGEVVVVDDKLGVTMTEIVKSDRN